MPSLLGAKGRLKSVIFFHQGTCLMDDWNYSKNVDKATFPTLKWRVLFVLKCSFSGVSRLSICTWRRWKTEAACWQNVANEMKAVPGHEPIMFEDGCVDDDRSKRPHSEPIKEFHPDKRVP